MVIEEIIAIHLIVEAAGRIIVVEVQMANPVVLELMDVRVDGSKIWTGVEITERTEMATWMGSGTSQLVFIDRDVHIIELFQPHTISQQGTSGGNYM